MNSLTTKKKNGSTQPSESFGCFCSEIYVCGNQKVANQDQNPKNNLSYRIIIESTGLSYS